MATPNAPKKRSPLTPSTITPPSLDRQHSYNSRKSPNNKPSPIDATSALAKVASRPNSPRQTPASTPLASPSSELPAHHRRSSWDSCSHKRDGYISFPDFDQLRAAVEREGVRT
ncbi:hypothetical protein MBLNU230_g2700t1 [Neophaeotheca triangularis]